LKCLDEKSVADFVNGRIAPAMRLSTEAHVDGCANCRRLIADEVKRSLFRDVPGSNAATVVEGRHGIETAPTLRMMRKAVGASDAHESPLTRARFAVGEVVGDRYRLESFITSGGMAEVWRAVDTQLDVPVAVKLLGESFEDDTEVVARFQREAKAAARLRTPHVVTIHGLGVHDSVPYIVMEFLDGEDLDVRLERRGRLSLPEAEDILRQAARAIQRAHDEGIVHRDLKPSNVFLAQVDGKEVVKILDFGIAKVTAAMATGSLTRTGQVMGTLHYMSPEQAIGDRHVDHRSDLWSLAMIVFRMVTGELGVTAETVAEAINKIVHGEVSPATSIAPDLPMEIDAFFTRAFSFSRDKRFQSADELVAAFSEIVSSSVTRRRAARPSLPPVPPLVLPMQPPERVIQATPQTFIQRTRASTRSRRAGTLALAIAGLVLVGALAAILLVMGRDSNARTRDATNPASAADAPPHAPEPEPDKPMQEPAQQEQPTAPSASTTRVEGPLPSVEPPQFLAPKPSR
jgi:serine/threonine-protein kinase